MAPKRKAAPAALEKSIKPKDQENEKPLAKKVKSALTTSPPKTRSRTWELGATELNGNAKKELKEPKLQEKTPTKTTPKKASKKAKDVTRIPAKDANKKSNHIVIEHCKQCYSFKTRALKVKEELARRIEGLRISINPDKPRKGCFEVRSEEGIKFVSLLGMPRPFKLLKELNLEDTVDQIVAKLR
ncbi:hypothetical protein O6H91_04G015800 [Diphasiastrum complanatum]|uniref:Uncharacterized protein n=3 Tax=Diphasiastrum complanatum TaxID=34168 RepID=A0ACC2DUV3_DIPCM|nr:hypothetical protein O6H91_Y506800 [Diphasiastrum complanatum]KAJ7298648.1 hypothetical protein O6H91_Y506800 [Diphasiastrum complanatum]KAJ7557915.1 hypothetical protein O6H91_04G015800 [Diphasiastrum complanatum]KAJ7557916.1 hypothetical protein O6H91_04G015800 [Diphasiastrum complanatum]KAJ7557917.1 hypothetical protein O6H91_04G015800 [Diphasiastrum complanatum]